MEQELKRKIVGISLSILILILCLTPPAQSYFNFPTQQRLIVGEQLKIDLNFPKHFLQKISYYVEAEPGNLLQLNGRVFSKSLITATEGWPTAIGPGKVNIQMKLFGFVPLKKVTVDVLPPKEVIVGGHSIGVLMRSSGVTVIGFSPVVDSQGQKFYPAKESGVEIGDIIVSINGQEVNTDGEAAQEIDKLGDRGQEIELLVKRKNKNLIIKIKPRYCYETKRNRIGLYIRDNAAGVGTLTFYDPKTGYYGALGHIISDGETSKQIALGDGRIVNAAIKDIHQGQKGKPGEKIGVFSNETNLTGDIRKNTKFGIFGKLTNKITNPHYPVPIPVAFAHQVREGKAEILTVVEGEKIEKFSIIIDKVILQNKPDGKGLIIRITDPRLISKTGGIIQGMSGSPIIQDGRLVGAVTHVFINDPTRGYGILAEWMLLESGILENEIKQVGKGSIPFPLFLHSSNLVSVE